MRQAHSIEIDRPVSEVFAYAEDPDNAPDWAEGIVRFDLLDEVEGHVGTRYMIVVKEGGRENAYEGEVVAWEDDRHTKNRVVRDGMVMTMDRWYTPVPGGTKLTMELEVRLAGIARLMSPVVWAMNRHFLKKQTNKLKELVEARAPTA